MASSPIPDCNNRMLREAGRNLNQIYDQFLAPTGLRSTQFSLLAKLKRLGPVGIHALAADMGLDRTTLGRNILPLQRDGLIAVELDAADKRSKQLRLTALGLQRLEQARRQWAKAQQAFETAFGAERAASLRELLREVSQLSLG
jgi:DNA-binding MarR family transcriptional regulator